MPNEGPSQEIKQETHEAPKVTNENKIDKPYSTYFSNPEVAQKVQNQIDKYKTTYPKIEETFTSYLKNNPNILRIKNMLLEKNLNDPEKFEKQINSIIDSCTQEITVFPKQELEKLEQIQVINNNRELNLKEKETSQKEKETSQKEQITKEITEKQIKLFEETKNEHNKFIANHPDLKINTEGTSQKLEESGTLKLLKDKGLSDENINSFITFKATQEAIQSDPSIKDADNFLLSFKQLENELNLPDSTRDSFSSKNINQTSQELFDPDIGNQNLIDTITSKQKSHADKVQELFVAPKNLSELDTLYGQFFPKEQALYKTVQDKQNQKKFLTEKEQKFLKDYQSKLETQKTAYEQISANTIEKSAILGPIMGLAEYMNMDIGNTFEFNKSNDIHIQNNKLSITGSVQNQPFTLATHLDKAGKLETSDYLHPIGNNLFELDKNHTQETPYILPGQQEIWTTITDNFAKIQTELLAQGLTPNQYQEVLQKTLCEQIKTLYGQKELVQARMEKQIAKDIANQATLDMLNDSFFHGKYEYGKSISMSENPELFNFIKDFDKTLESASSDEIKSWTNSLDQLKIILSRAEIGESKKNNTEIFKSFKKEIVENTKDCMSRKDHKKPNIFSFFSCLKNSKTKTLELDEFSNLIEENNKSQPNPNKYPTIQKQWNELQHQIQQEDHNKKTEHEQKEADRELNESLSNI